jgi:hypothetical protein
MAWSKGLLEQGGAQHGSQMFYHREISGTGEQSQPFQPKIQTYMGRQRPESTHPRRWKAKTRLCEREGPEIRKSKACIKKSTEPGAFYLHC